MSNISLNLSQTTIKALTKIAKEHDATLNEVALYVLTKGLAHYASSRDTSLPQIRPATATQKEL